MWKSGDLVARKSYGKDLCFVIVEVDEASETAILKGIDVRLMADAPFSDLELLSEEERQQFEANRKHVEDECLRLVHTRRAMESEKRSLRKEARFHSNPDFLSGPDRFCTWTVTAPICRNV
ncbi:hypothetical protein GCM10025857_19040 [Alicyclobacillus contaminans]|nr:hypothetical protein GCM10025857_19040 [Alicyclobacillus contaminans]